MEQRRASCVEVNMDNNILNIVKLITNKVKRLFCKYTLPKIVVARSLVVEIGIHLV